MEKEPTHEFLQKEIKHYLDNGGIIKVLPEQPTEYNDCVYSKCNVWDSINNILDLPK